MATIWKGALTFGLVHIPVELRPAVRADHLSFRLLHKTDLTPVKFERVSAKTGKPVPWAEIVKGYEYTKGKYVVVTDEDFKAAALESSKTIDILDFVPAAEIDPRYFETPYYLVPAKGGEKAYALLREAVRQGGVIGIGKIVMRQTQHLAGVKVVGDALVLELMRFATELLDADAYTFPAASLVRPQELAMAEQLVANLAEPFHPAKYTDEHRANLMKMIQAKMQGTKIDVPTEDTAPGDTDVLDLMSRLRASLGQTGAKRSAKPAGKSTATGPAKSVAKTVAKRAPRRKKTA